MQLAVHFRDPKDQRRFAKCRTIEAEAWKLFEAHGFDATTVDDIADATGISQRTFFRYFESKEAVLYGQWAWQLDVMTRRIEKAGDDVAPLDAVRAAVMSLAEGVERERHTVLMRARLTASSTSARSYYRTVVQPAWEEATAAALAARYGLDPDADPTARSLAGAAVGALNAAMGVWVAGGCADLLPEITRKAFGALSAT